MFIVDESDWTQNPFIEFAYAEVSNVPPDVKRHIRRNYLHKLGLRRSRSRRRHRPVWPDG